MRKCHLIDRQWRCLRLLSRDTETARDVQRSARGSSQPTTGDLQRLVFSALYIRGRRTLAGERQQSSRVSFLRLGSQSSPSRSDTNFRSILTLLVEAARLRNLKFRPRDNGSTSHRIPFSITAALYFLRRLLISDKLQTHRSRDLCSVAYLPYAMEIYTICCLCGASPKLHEFMKSHLFKCRLEKPHKVLGSPLQTHSNSRPLKKKHSRCLTPP
jgi:hypothetical protein